MPMAPRPANPSIHRTVSHLLCTQAAHQRAVCVYVYVEQLSSASAAAACMVVFCEPGRWYATRKVQVKTQAIHTHIISTHLRSSPNLGASLQCSPNFRDRAYAWIDSLPCTYILHCSHWHACTRRSHTTGSLSCACSSGCCSCVSL